MPQPITFNTKRDPRSGMLPDGVYPFYVETVKEVHSGEFPQLTLGVRAIVDGEKWGSLVWENLSKSPKARWRVDTFFNSVGAPDESAEAGATWFKGKAGWAWFVQEDGTDGVTRPKVKQWLTEVEAEKKIAKLAEIAGTDPEAIVMNTQRTTRMVDDGEAAPKARGGKSKQAAAVAELNTDEDIPF